MDRHRFSIARLMHGVAVVAFPAAILAGTIHGRPILGLGYGLDCGLMASVPVLVALSPATARRGRDRPFVLGLVAAGWAAVVGYVALCMLGPEVVMRPIRYYLNEIEPRFLDADTLPLYALSLTIVGLILATPQFLVALAGGLLARRVVRPGPAAGRAAGLRI